MKVKLLSMVYCNADVFQAGMASLYRTTYEDPTEYDHYVLDAHYPLKHEEVSEALRKDSQLFQTKILDSGENKGLHENLNYAISQMDVDDDTLVVAFDPDENPTQRGWLQAMVKVFEADPKCGWLSLMSQPIKDNLDQANVAVQNVGGVNVRIPGYSLMNLLCGWRGSAIKAVGRFTEPFTYYGGLEISMMPKFKDAGFWTGWLADYWTTPHHSLADSVYQEYKRRHVGFALPVFPGSFEDFVKLEGNK